MAAACFRRTVLDPSGHPVPAPEAIAGVIEVPRADRVSVTLDERRLATLRNRWTGLSGL